MSSDFYTVLGVDRGASQADIKQAYRALARKYHPDRNPGDEEAANRFKDAAEAYRVLGDAELRAQYDRHQRGGGFAEGEEASDVLDELFGTRQRRSRPAQQAPREPAPRARSRGPERGDDLRYTLSISFEDAAFGASHEITVPGWDRCGDCGGTGARSGSAPAICGDCSGSGTVRRQRGFFEESGRCAACGGSGRRVVHDCGGCRGSGQRQVERELRVQVPPGVATGTRLKLAGEGGIGSGGGAPGDLFVVLDVKPHPLFEREGDDLLTDVPVSFTEAALGAQIEIPTLEGRMRMRIPPGSQSGRVFRLKGKGFPGARGGDRGDQRVRIVVETPTQLTPRQRQLLEALAEIEEEEGIEGSRLEQYRRQLQSYYD